tara:strand:- start:117 stop:305 length:189 start_codon:yes stop_codon:yes gene_type:complete
MKNMTELRDELGKVFDRLEAGDLSTKIAAEMNNSAGKMINSVKVQLEYAALRKETPRIPFCE